MIVQDIVLSLLGTPENVVRDLVRLYCETALLSPRALGALRDRTVQAIRHDFVGADRIEFPIPLTLLSIEKGVGMGQSAPSV